MFHSLGAEVAGRDESPVLEQAEKYSDCDITSTFNYKEAANLIVMSTMRNRTPLEENKKKMATGGPRSTGVFTPIPKTNSLSFIVC